MTTISTVGSMAPVTKETCSISGSSGDITLNGAVTGCLGLSQTIADGRTVTYVVYRDGVVTESWSGTFTAPSTLSRGTLKWNTSGSPTSAYDWPAGEATVYVVPSYDRMVTLDAAGTTMILGDGSTPANGTLWIGNGTGFVKATLTGTANQAIVTNSAGGITISTPQDTHTGASPTFAGMTVSKGGADTDLSIVQALQRDWRLRIPSGATDLIIRDESGGNNRALFSAAGYVFLGMSGTDTTGSSASFVVLPVVNSNHYITASGSNGGNPTIGTSGGGLTISARLRLSNLPTSAAGLSTGDVWLDGGILKVV